MAEATLTQQQQKVLAFVDEYSRRQGFPPTLREIGRAIGVTNVNAVRGHVSALEKKGYITRAPDKARSLRVVHGPSPLSRLKRKLHQVLRTDEGVRHGVVYGAAWTTWRRTPYSLGQRGKWLLEALRRVHVEHGWRALELRVEPDHVAVTVAAWPNHSPELVVRRFRAAGRSLKRRRPKEFPGGRLWGKGYVVTTDLELLNELVERLLGEQENEDKD